MSRFGYSCRQLVLVCLLGSGLATATAQKEAAETPKPVPKTLVKEAAKALRGKPAKVPGSLGVVHELVKRQLAADEAKKSLTILKKALRVQPWDMLCNVYYAEALQALDKTKQARKKALWILDHAREDRARRGAARIADEPPMPPLEALEPARSGEKPRVVLLPVPPVDDAVVFAVRARLAQRLTVPVVVRKGRFSLPPKPSRGETPEALKKYQARFEESATDDEVDALLKRHRLKYDHLLEPHIFAFVYRPWLVRTGRWKDLREFDRDVTAKRRLQWEANTLGGWIQRAVGRGRRAQDYYLGITAADIHLGDDMRYNFAASGRRFSTIAYSRFLPWFTREDPDFTRLVTRVHKQVMCSIGRCSGIRACPDYGCACSYANGLPDHDAKQEAYCPRCREKIPIAK